LEIKSKLKQKQEFCVLLKDFGLNQSGCTLKNGFWQESISKLHPQQDQMLTGWLIRNEDPRTMMYGNVSSASFLWAATSQSLSKLKK
jgi:hypothetical protein